MLVAGAISSIEYWVAPPSQVHSVVAEWFLSVIVGVAIASALKAIASPDRRRLPENTPLMVLVGWVLGWKTSLLVGALVAIALSTTALIAKSRAIAINYFSAILLVACLFVVLVMERMSGDCSKIDRGPLAAFALSTGLSIVVAVALTNVALKTKSGE